jgi:hypothetical protein
MGQHTPPARQRQLVTQWRASNLSAAAFARAHKVRAGTFRTWIARHPPEPNGGTPKAAFVEVTPASDTFAVQIGPHVLAFAEPPPAVWLASLVRELGSC